MEKPSLKIDWATHEAAEYACKKWHYSGTMPPNITKPVKIGAWENGEFVGCIIFTHGASSGLGKPYGLSQIQVCELQRVALREHKTEVTRLVAIALRFLKKHCPGLRLVVSFADPFEGHHGGIYQGGNWIFTGITAPSPVYFDENGTQRHSRNVGKFTGRDKHGVWKHSSDHLTKEIRPGKYRYLMPLDEEMRKQIEPLRKPYPKRAGSKDNVASANHAEEGGANPTPALQLLK